MATYIALLRGINVSGQKLIKMENLKKSFVKAGFKNVQTYVQSGNVIFEAPESPTASLTKKIEKLIFKVFGFEVPTIVLTTAELKQVVKNNPFQDKEESSLYVAFLAEKVSRDAVKIIAALETEREKFNLKARTIYLCYDLGFGKAKTTNNTFEKKLAVKVTTRNWNTCNQLLALATKKTKSP